MNDIELDDTPHIMNLREFTAECRKMAPRVLRMMSELIDNKNDLSPSEQMMLSVLVSDRAYERPRQQLTTLGRALDGDAPRVTVYIPDNNRNKVIDVESIPSRDLFKESE